MNINFRIDRNYEYLKFLIYGTFNKDDLVLVFEKALDTAKKEGYKAVLIDTRDLKDTRLTTMERFDIGKAVAVSQTDGNNHICFALVGEEPFIDPRRFGETVALNRGAFGKVFTDIDEAVTWINEVIN